MRKQQIYLAAFSKGIKSKLPKFFSDEFLNDLSVRVLSVVGLAFLVGIWIYALLNFSPTEYAVPLRYNSFLGVTELGGWYKLYAIPLLLVLIFFLNSLLANVTYKKDKMVSYILMGTNIFVCVCGLTVIVNLSIIINR